MPSVLNEELIYTGSVKATLMSVFLVSLTWKQRHKGIQRLNQFGPLHNGTKPSSFCIILLYLSLLELGKLKP